MYGKTVTIHREKADPNLPIIHDLVAQDLFDQVGGEVRDLLLADLRERQQYGLEKYGVPLQPGDGNDLLQEIYQEILDGVIYTRQALEEGIYLEPFYRRILAELAYLRARIAARDENAR